MGLTSHAATEGPRSFVGRRSSTTRAASRAIRRRSSASSASSALKPRRRMSSSYGEGSAGGSGSVAGVMSIGAASARGGGDLAPVAHVVNDRPAERIGDLVEARGKAHFAEAAPE